MNDVYILWHLGMGDHILCNGLIRSIARDCESIFLPVKHHNLKNVSDMFKDVPNINFFPVIDDEEMIKNENILKRYVEKIIKIGIFGENFMKDSETFDESFYKQAGLPYTSRWDNFSYLVEEEKQIKRRNTEEYVFVHDDISRELNIKEKYLKEKNIFRPDHKLGKKEENTLFHYFNIIKNATEIHCMDSSFACFIDHIPELKNKKKYIHRYIRRDDNNPKYLNNWKLIND